MIRARAVVVAVGVCVLASCGSRTPLACERAVAAVPAPPTLYFVLDHSGSMAQNGKWEAIRAALGAVADQLGPRARVGIAMFPPSAGEGCAPGQELVAPTEGLGGDAIRAATALRPSGGTPLAATVNALAPRLLSLAADAALVAVVVTDGGPNCNPNLTCTVARCTNNLDGTGAACTPGGNNCCAPGGVAGVEGCLDDDGAVAAVSALAAGGVRTFVLGVPGSEPYAAALERLAVAGQTARDGEPRYYRADTADAAVFEDALAQVVRASETSCDLRLAEPLLPQYASVSVGGRAVPADARDGWTLSSDRMTLHGAACAARAAGAGVAVSVDDQCPSR